MHLDSYSFGRVVVDSKEYTSDILVVGDKIIDWWREEGHLLQVEDLEEVWKYHPDVLVIGQGASGVMKIAQGVRDKCADLGIELIAGITSEAAKEVNKLGGKKIAFGLHLTC